MLVSPAIRAGGALLTAILVASPAYSGDLLPVEIGAFQNPTFVAAPPGRPDLLFVVERPGRILVLRDERPRARAFLDIRHLVRGLPDEGAGQEQGLLSMAFPPDYETSGRFYVAYTNNDGNIQIDEFMRLTPVRASPKSRRILLVIPHPGARNHNGGQLQFGPDSLLYISTGDGGAVDPPRGEAARNLGSLLGKILRINPLPGARRPYRIPRNNPYVGRTGRDEIFAYGLRNPWRFSFDSGRIAIADVGQNRREEVNILARRNAAGVNFGWPQYEGDLEFDNMRPGPDPATFPLFVYDHAANRCAIVGGYVVRDPDLPTLAGRYLYGDACTGELRSFVPNVAKQRAIDDRPSGVALPVLTSFGEGAQRKLYAMRLDGRLYRLEAPTP